MNKRIPEKETFLFVRSAPSSRIFTIRLTIHHNEGAISITNLDKNESTYMGAFDGLDVWHALLGEIKQFATERIEAAKSLVIDEK